MYFLCCAQIHGLSVMRPTGLVCQHPQVLCAHTHRFSVSTPTGLVCLHPQVWCAHTHRFGVPTPTGLVCQHPQARCGETHWPGVPTPTGSVCLDSLARCAETHWPGVPTPTGLVCQNPKARCTETSGPRFLNFDNFARFWAFFAHILCANFSDWKFCVCYFVSFFHLRVHCWYPRLHSDMAPLHVWRGRRVKATLANPFLGHPAHHQS